MPKPTSTAVPKPTSTAGMPVSLRVAAMILGPALMLASHEGSQKERQLAFQEIEALRQMEAHRMEPGISPLRASGYQPPLRRGESPDLSDELFKGGSEKDNDMFNLSFSESLKIAEQSGRAMARMATPEQIKIASSIKLAKGPMPALKVPAIPAAAGRLQPPPMSAATRAASNKVNAGIAAERATPSLSELTGASSRLTPGQRVATGGAGLPAPPPPPRPSAVGTLQPPQTPSLVAPDVTTPAPQRPLPPRAVSAPAAQPAAPPPVPGAVARGALAPPPSTHVRPAAPAASLPSFANGIPSANNVVMPTVPAAPSGSKVVRGIQRVLHGEPIKDVIHGPGTVAKEKAFFEARDAARKGVTAPAPAAESGALQAPGTPGEVAAPTPEGGGMMDAIKGHMPSAGKLLAGGALALGGYGAYKALEGAGNYMSQPQGQYNFGTSQPQQAARY